CVLCAAIFFFFFFQAEDGIRDGHVTGVQTCALPISFIEMGLVAFLLTIPLLLKWHHEMLIICWNLGAMFFFLPGRPEAWLAAAWMSFIFACLQYILNPRQKFLSVPSVTKPLLFLVAVVVTTAICRGGFGLAAFGSDTYGGKKYL